ncbi:LysR family transcriptional regulator [Mucilaginibacter sp. UR6-11]|uniref:LysR family transcriptional regulator n=1 Tax=Mucilaginibacter sp. UR6-11 TaxID=1435644 RepID=UPI001E2B2A1F|nr:LysR family transcriptional regulator [Mucilaginibacter sp. UR6-11]MCC8427063.1 LysR family transcriptional regulator [Mucilaginibacter sp. UR6-11]
MEIRHLLYFKAVAAHLHFRNAAASLFISQPPLSRQIKELEEELGVRLFLRNNKRVALTDAGKYFAASVDSILNQLEESKNVAKQIHLAADSGELKIGYISSVYQPHLAEVLKALRSVFPYIKTSLYERPTIKQIEALEQGKLDVGILRAPVQSAKLTVQTLFFDPFMVVMPSVGKKFSSNQQLAEFIKNKPFIFFNKEYAPQYFDKLVEICHRLGFEPDITHEVNNVHSIVQLVEAGLGVTILPLSLKQQYAGLQLSFAELRDIPVNTEVVLAYKKANLNGALKWFIKNYSDK